MAILIEVKAKIIFYYILKRIQPTFSAYFYIIIWVTGSILVAISHSMRADINNQNQDIGFTL